MRRERTDSRGGVVASKVEGGEAPVGGTHQAAADEPGDTATHPAADGDTGWVSGSSSSSKTRHGPASGQRPPQFLGISLANIAVSLLVVQICAGSLLARYSRTQETPYISSTAVVVAETIKFLTSVVIVLRSEASVGAGVGVLRKAIFGSPKDMALLAVPAVTYVVQNNLYFVAISNLDVGTMSVLLQLKLLTAAFFAVVLLGSRLSRRRWIALFILFIGVSIVQVGAATSTPAAPVVHSSDAGHAGLHEAGAVAGARAGAVAGVTGAAADGTDDKDAGGGDWRIGTVAVLVLTVLSGFAGVTLEKILKSGGVNSSLWVRNSQLALISIGLSLVGAFTNDREAIIRDGFLSGYTVIVWIVVANIAVGGFMVSLVVKFTDNIRKGFAGALSTVITPVLSWALLDGTLSLSLFGGGFLVAVATTLYSVPDQKPTNLEGARRI